ncbi:LacI family DNA-binding transcriptional regulator [Clostridium saccharobutylicum]|uniref:Catabolite control protein A n=1 Tax=Clostridium saccharobutylicum TaxID=169679 RepID=A0A1S8NC85_CLOSA|nr:LacI family DNA-binding transcriptional regulator [Clostridium saccharobutylicum]OOM13881.1 catabolite control protein A [Clostridium saccharobutylicum]
MRSVTMSDIAQEAKVSKTTVSKVLNNREINVSDSTRQNILNIAKRLNYIPNGVARSLTTRRTNTIGIILPDIENPFFAAMAKTIEEMAENRGYNVILCNSYNNEEKEDKYIRLLISKLVDGVIYGSGGNSKESLNVLRSNKVPFVVVDRYIDSTYKYSGVFSKNIEGVKRGVRYLYDLNHRNIAFVGGSCKVKLAKMRNESYVEISKELGVYNKDLMVEADFSIEGGMRATENLLSITKDIDAIFYSSDVMALGGMKYLIRHGYKIPDDISVLGFDNINISALFEPELTTVAQPIYEIGKTSCELLIDIIEKNCEDKIIELDTNLIQRNSVKMKTI